MRPTARWISVGVFVLLGCGNTPKLPEGQPLKAAYREAQSPPATAELAGRIELKSGDDALGAPRPYVPVLAPPEVFSVYVLPHTNEDGQVSVQGHWVHIKLTASHWWHQDRQEPSSFNLDELATPPHRSEKQEPVKQAAPTPLLEDVEGTK